MAGQGQDNRHYVFLLSVLLAIAILFAAWLYMKTQQYMRSTPTSAYAEPTPTPVTSPVLTSPEDRREIVQARTTNKDKVSSLAEALAMKEKQGKDNALAHYARASLLVPCNQDGFATMSALMSAVLANGWNKEAESLHLYLAPWQPVLREVRKAVALRNEERASTGSIPAMSGSSWTEFSFASKALAVEGVFLESRHRDEEALDSYLAALAVIRDCMLADGDMISHVVGMNAESILLRRIAGMAVNGDLSSESLRRVTGTLAKMENPRDIAIATVRKELAKRMASIRQAKQGIDEGVFQKNTSLWDVVVFHDKRTWKEYVEARKERRILCANKDRIEPDAEAIQNLSLRYLQAPWWEYKRDRYWSEMSVLRQKSHPVAQEGAQYYDKDYTIVAESRLEGLRIVLALLSYKAKEGQFPDSLEALTAEFVPKGVPRDPFTGKSFFYRKTGERFILYSAGPDEADNSGAETGYTADGSIGTGDIVIVK